MSQSTEQPGRACDAPALSDAYVDELSDYVNDEILSNERAAVPC